VCVCWGVDCFLKIRVGAKEKVNQVPDLDHLFSNDREHWVLTGLIPG
jgi:hypothetical protein